MKKIILIIKREYLTRARKKTFILSTLLFPLLYVALIFGSGYLGKKAQQKLSIAVIDSSGYFNKGQFERANIADSSLKLNLINVAADSLQKNFGSMGYDGFIVIPGQPNWENGFSSLKLRSEKKFGPGSVGQVENRLNNFWNDVKNEKLGIDEAKKQILSSSRVSIATEDMKGKSSNEKIIGYIGYIAGFLMYFILIIYGSQVMMGVMEEKTNRIAEVIVSSVKPFQLMVGKIVGIGLVAITQFLLWIVFMFVLYNVTKQSSQSSSTINDMLGTVQTIFSSVNVPLVLFTFGFYLLGGFFFYASLFAAIGSAVNEDMREAQSLSFPVTMIVIFSIMLMPMALNNPTGPIAFWCSILPFTSPVIMPALVPFGVPDTIPLWQLLLSMLVLVAGFIGTTWFAGKIYRTGILMYGKKPSWKEMLKWAFRNN